MPHKRDFGSRQRQTEGACDQRDVGGCGIVWNDGVDLSCDELRENGIEVATPFDGLMSSAGATELWGLSESTLRKAVTYTRTSSAPRPKPRGAA